MISAYVSHRLRTDQLYISYWICTFTRIFIIKMCKIKEEIWLSPLTKAPTPTKKNPKKQRDNTKPPPKMSIIQRLQTDLRRSVGVTIGAIQKTQFDIWCIIILALYLEIRQFKKRQNFQCLFQSKSAKISRRQNNPIYGILLCAFHLVGMLDGSFIGWSITPWESVYSRSLYI